MGSVKLGIFHTQILWDLLHDIHFVYDEVELADLVVNKVSEALGAEAGTVFKVDTVQGLQDHCKLYPLASKGVKIEDLQKQHFEIGKGVVGWVVEYMQPVKVEDPDRDPRFYGKTDKSTGFTTRNIIASPIVARNKPLGVLEFINKIGGPFVIQDLELISMLGREIGIAMENVRLFKEINSISLFNQSLIHNLRVGLLVLNDKGELINVNPRAEEIFKIPLISKDDNKLPYNVILSPFPSLIHILSESFSSKKNVDWNKTNIIIAGKEETIYYSISNIIDKSGKHLGITFLIQNINI